MRFIRSESPLPLLERRTLKGAFHLMGWDESSEQFVELLAEHDLRYHEMRVAGDYWLRDTGWNRCLAKCADHLEKFSIEWTGCHGMRILYIR